MCKSQNDKDDCLRTNSKPVNVLQESKVKPKNLAYRKSTLNASKMRHNKKNKTIYYDNAIIKVYDLPIFYIPRLSHPDPSVDRRSGFLPPSF